MLERLILKFKTIMIDLSSIFYKDDKLENHLFYKDGDSDDKSTQIYCGGCLTSSKKAVVWSVVFPKRLDKIKTIQINSMRVSARHADGGYIITNGDPRDYGTIDYDIISENTITFTLTLKTAASFTNNTSVNVRFEADLIFKE